MRGTTNSLYEIAEQQGVLVLLCPLQKLEAVSCVDGEGRCSIGIDPQKLRSAADEREKLAHELGHCVTGAFYNRYSPFDSRSRHEARARRWALDALVPEPELQKALSEGRSLYELCEWFSVSEGTMRLALARHREMELSADPPCAGESFG